MVSNKYSIQKFTCSFKKKIVLPRIYRETFDLPLLALSQPLTALNSINHWLQKHNFPDGC